MSDSPAVILYDEDGNPVAVAEGNLLESFQKGIVIAGKDDDGYVRFVSINNAGTINVSDVGTASVSGSFYASTSLITGTVLSQNLASLANPIGSGNILRVVRVIVNGVLAGTSTTPFLYRISRTDTFPSNGTLITPQKRNTSLADVEGEVRQVPDVTKASGNIWVGSPGTSSAGGVFNTSLQEPVQTIFERDNVILLPGEAIVVIADGNSSIWAHWVNFQWDEVL